MSTQISTPVKIFAVVGLVLVLGLGAITMMKGGSSGSSSGTTPPAVTPTPPATPAPAAPAHPAAPASTSTPSAHATAPAANAQPATKTHAVAAKPHHVATKHHVVAKPKPVPAVAANGLPGMLDELLHIHQVVVVAVYDPEVPTDKLFVDEAQAGARDAKAGFFPVSVLDERVAEPMTAAAGNGSLLPSPGLLIYKAPGTLMNVLTGFIDRDAVAQAAANAALAEAPNTGVPSGSAPTTTAAAPTPTTAGQ